MTTRSAVRSSISPRLRVSGQTGQVHHQLRFAGTCLVRSAGYWEPLAYYHAHWTRNGAPLMDELGAVIDHVEAFTAGGACEPGNLVTACAKCNGRKSSATLETWDARDKRHPIKGKYGEPQHWDGLSMVFAVLAADPKQLTGDEQAWLKAIHRSLEVR